MATLAVATLLTVLDSLAKGVQLFEGGIGVSTGDANTVAKGAANNVATLVAVADADLAELVMAFDRRQALVTASALYRTLQGPPLMTALDEHYGGVGGLNRVLRANNKRVHPNLTKIGLSIDSVNTFCPDVVTLATFAVTGSGAGTFSAGTDIDTTAYGPANAVVRATTLIGAAPVVATCTLRLIDGTSTTKVVTLPAGSPSGTEVAIGTPGTDMFVACTGITITGGTTGDAFSVRTAVERTLTL